MRLDIVTLTQLWMAINVLYVSEDTVLLTGVSSDYSVCVLLAWQREWVFEVRLGKNRQVIRAGGKHILPPAAGQGCGLD